MSGGVTSARAERTGRSERCTVAVFVLDQELRTTTEVRLMTALKATGRSTRVSLTSWAVA